MREIELKNVPMEIDGKKMPLDYRVDISALLLIPLDQVGGANYAEMATILPIHAKFQASTNSVLLEDTEHDEVVKRLKIAKFKRITPELSEMIRSVVEAPTVSVSKDQS